MLEAIGSDDRLCNAKLIAEPWDPGPGGYQLGQFPSRWAEWNDRYRDAVRKFWRGDEESVGELAKCLHGSADVFEAGGRSSPASVNLVSSHDGFTLADVVSYEHRHNHANGEDNQDGHQHNYSCNHGIEGSTDDPSIVDKRRCQKLNMLATLLFSQGTPLLLGGDEFGHSQQGNNNAYAQDNETGWLDWTKLNDDPEFAAQVRKLVWLRRKTPLLRLREYVHGRLDTNHGVVEIRWLKPDGQAMSDHDWSSARTFCVVLSETSANGEHSAAAILINGSDTASTFVIPEFDDADDWRPEFSSAADAVVSEQTATLPAFAISLLLSGHD
jgi:glycogen operon protein